MAQLLFSENAGDTVVLDALVLEGGALPTGTPVTLRVRPPETPLIAQLVRSRLAAWAAGGDIVHVELRRRRRTTTAVVSDGRSSVTLDLGSPRVA